MVFKITRHFPTQKEAYFILLLFMITTLMIIVQVSKYKHSYQSFLLKFAKTAERSHKENIQCFKMARDSLPDISDIQPSKGKSIFFHETSCKSHLNGKISIDARQACAVESAARLNPNFEVYLLYASPGLFKFEGTESDGLLEALLSYENIQIRHVDYGKYTKGTPVEKLYSGGEIEKSKYPQWHANDVLRYLTLWKYGGIYLDFDVIVLKPLESLPLNYAGYEDWSNVGSGIISFSPDGRGHVLAGKCLDDLKNNFKRYIWGNSDHSVITRLVNKICKEKRTRNAIHRDCNGFKVFSQQTFYPIPYWKWKTYFEEKEGPKELEKLADSYVARVWNEFSGDNTVAVEGNSTFAILARNFCPRVVEECGDFL